MAGLTPGFKRTKSNWAFYIESDIHFVPGGDDLKLGFRIVYRVIFRYLGGSPAAPITLAKQVRDSFMNIFGLDDEHVCTEKTVMDSSGNQGSGYWEVYWDKGYLDLQKIHLSDVALNSIAKRNQVAVEHISTTVMARELSALKTLDIDMHLLHLEHSPA